MARLTEWTLSVALQVAVFFAAVVALLIYVPNSPLPDALNPSKPLNPRDAPNFLTNWKLKRATETPLACQAALSGLGAQFNALPDHNLSRDCGIKGNTELRSVSGAKLNPVKTKCATALRLAMWVQHDVQPAAKSEFSESITALDHFGSFSCRPIRSNRAGSSRMSEHATANAIDISGFTLSNEERITLKDDWQNTEYKEFLRIVRDGACRWFNVTLSPDYNALHHDHFHFDQGIWRSCR